MAIREVDLGKVRGDINDSQATFTQSETRTNIVSGEKGSVIFGKIKKWFADLGTAAFCSVVNNATTTAANTVLDGRMGKALQTGIDELNSSLVTKTRVIEGAYINMQVTSSGKVSWIRISGYPKLELKEGQTYTLFRPTANTPMYTIYRRIYINQTLGFILQISNVDAETSITPFGGDITVATGINVSECYILK